MSSNKGGLNQAKRKFNNFKKGSSVQEKIWKSKRNEKSSMLRKYAKLCKREGVQSDRVNMNPRLGVEGGGGKDESAAVGQHRPAKKDKEDAHKKKRGDDAFAIAEKAAERKRSEQQQREEESARIEREKQKAKALRNKKTKELNKRTPSGQPVMKYRITNILDKLMAEKKG